MPSVPVTWAVLDRLVILSLQMHRTVEDLVDELLTEAVVEMEWRSG